MFEKLKKILGKSNAGYKSYNMIICANNLHKSICKCSCHVTPGTLHIIDCCHQETCADCKKILNITQNKY